MIPVCELASRETTEQADKTMHPVYILAFATFIVVAGFLVWTRVSTSRHRFGRNNPTGIGGENDPLSGATDAVRDPDELRASLDAGRRPEHTH